MLPYTSGRLRRRPDVAPIAAAAFANPFLKRNDATLSVGADVKYRLTSNFTLDATINPDFGQVEQDPAVVNLTAFEMRFDERRPFFVEGAEIMRFGTSVQGNPEGGPLQLLYSRRVGTDATGRRPARRGLLGRHRGDHHPWCHQAHRSHEQLWSVGLLEAVTQKEVRQLIDANRASRESVVEPLANYFAGRLRRDLRGGRTTFSGMLTAVNRKVEAGSASDLLRSSANAAGLDFRIETDDRVWSVFGSFSPSLGRGSPAATAATQRSSAHFFQRPDADHLDYDPLARSMSGYRLRAKDTGPTHSASPRSASIGSRGRDRRTTTCSVRSCSGSMRTWLACGRWSRVIGASRSGRRCPVRGWTASR